MTINIEAVVDIARLAGEAILKVYHSDKDIGIQTKSDDSPVTKADLAAHHVIEDALSALDATVPILSEESGEIAFHDRAKWQRYWLVDPLDGTKEFIHRTGDFSVNIALIDKQQSVMGITYVPLTDTVYYAEQGKGAFKQIGNESPAEMRVLPVNRDAAMRVVMSRRHGTERQKAFLDKLERYQLLSRGSALKICLVAEGKADIYPRFGPTCEWDTAAAQCILEEAGGALIALPDLNPLIYNTKDSLLNPEFLAIGDKSYPWEKTLPDHP